MKRNRSAKANRDHEVVVIGAGIAGIGIAARLKLAGIDDFVVIERSGDIGGTWRDNAYPGVAVDVPAWGYQFSFELNPEWSRLFPPGAEIKAYLDHCADKYGLRPHLRLLTEVRDVAYDEQTALWTVQTSNGPVRARYAVIAIGPFAEPKLPDIPGLDTFEGELVHTSKWSPEVNLASQHVAVIGTGASAVQLVPKVVDQVEHLHVFQRTPIWILPKPDMPLKAIGPLMHSLPLFNRVARLGTAAALEAFMVTLFVYYRESHAMANASTLISKLHLRLQVPDAGIRDRLSPKYAFGCKRPGLSNDYLRAFVRQNVELVTDGIECITPRGVKTVDGKERDVSTLILATGFAVADPERMPPVKITGKGGRDLHAHWSENRPQAYEGASVPGYPNLFFVFGPYAFNAGSYTNMVENQATHLIRVITEARRRGTSVVEVTEEATARYTAEILERMEHTIFKCADCSGSNSYYFDEHGVTPFIRPQSTLQSWWRSKKFPLEDYQFSMSPSESERTNVPRAAKLSLVSN